MAELSYSQTRQLANIARNFELEDGVIDIIEGFGSGRINGTYKVTIRHGVKRHEYLLQHINNNVFPDTAGLMNNLTLVTEFVRRNGGAALNYIKCRDDVCEGHQNGPYIFVDDAAKHWRMYHYIDADVYPCIINSNHAFMLGEAIANFSNSLDGFDTKCLIETIPDFHNTPKRYKDLLVSVAHDTIDNRAQRVIPVKDYVKAIMDKEDLLSILMDALENGVIPYRVVHNDPKLNNVLFDKATAEPICMIDLDTIMPGTSLFDVGDALRSIANTASEDDKTTDNVSFSTEIFEKFVTGYIKGMCGKLTTAEIELIPESIWVIAMELGMRFLKDHIDGNKYFATEYDGQNLERARIQLKLADCVYEKISSGELHGIVHEIQRKVDDYEA